jgi:RNA recognition motif-containing protein
MNIFVGSLSYDVTEGEFKELFEACGEVTSAKIITDRDTGRSKGFGFVEMPNKSEAQEAIDTLNGKDVSGRTIVVNEARPREERPRRNFGGGGNRGGRY